MLGTILDKPIHEYSKIRKAYFSWLEYLVVGALVLAVSSVILTELIGLTILNIFIPNEPIIMQIIIFFFVLLYSMLLPTFYMLKWRRLSIAFDNNRIKRGDLLYEELVLFGASTYLDDKLISPSAIGVLFFIVVTGKLFFLDVDLSNQSGPYLLWGISFIFGPIMRLYIFFIKNSVSSCLGND